MPYTILDAKNLSNSAKILYLHLWKDAFCKNKKHEGKHYSEMIEAEAAKKMNCTRKTIRRCFQQLHKACVIETKKARFKSKHFFLAKHRWKLDVY